MRRIRVISRTAVFLIFGFSGAAYARQEKPEKQEETAAPPKQEKQAKPEKQEQAKPQQQHAQEQAKPQEQHTQQAVKGQQEQQQKQQQQQAKSNKQQEQHTQQAAKGHQEQGNSSNAPQRTQQAQARQHAQPELRLSARGNGRIPDEQFRSHFGRGHEFHMGNPVMVGGYSRFQYGGYWFGFAEPWPVGWYYTDGVYIDYIDGAYYMYDPYYPGARFELSVVI